MCVPLEWFAVPKSCRLFVRLKFTQTFHHTIFYRLIFKWNGWHPNVHCMIKETGVCFVEMCTAHVLLLSLDNHNITPNTVTIYCLEMKWNDPTAHSYSWACISFGWNGCWCRLLGKNIHKMRNMNFIIMVDSLAVRGTYFFNLFSRLLFRRFLFSVFGFLLCVVVMSSLIFSGDAHLRSGKIAPNN